MKEGRNLESHKTRRVILRETGTKAFRERKRDSLLVRTCVLVCVCVFMFVCVWVGV